MALRQDIGIDLGTATVLVYVKGRGIVLHEPSVVAVDKTTNRLVAIGEEARRMQGRVPDSILVVRPLRDGVISDFEVTEKMLKYFLNRIVGGGLFRLFRPRVMVCVPSGVTSVERRAVVDAAIQAGARKTYLIEEPIAAAIGAGVDIMRPSGCMVIDIGGGTTDIAVISMGGAVVSKSIRVAGDRFDEAIIKYLRRRHSVLIGDPTAEELKVTIGTAFERVQELAMDIRGRDLMTGLPRMVTVLSSHIREALEEPLAMIVDAVRGVLEITPPELVSDIAERGIVLTGGGSLLYGLDKLLSDRTGIYVAVAEDAVSCVALGTGEALNNIEAIEQSMMAQSGGRARL